MVQDEKASKGMIFLIVFAGIFILSFSSSVQACYNECVPELVFSCWSPWVEVDGECVDGLMNESRWRIQYDANVCGTFEDLFHKEYRQVECEMPCVPNLVNSSWSSWEDTEECTNGWKTQIRTNTEYDSNSCGTFQNKSYSQTREVECEMPCEEELVNTSWSQWTNISDCANGWKTQSRMRTEYDANVCGNFENNTYTKFRSIECEMPCIPNIVNSSWRWVNITSCSMDGKLIQQRIWTEYDANHCGTFQNIIHNESREINCTAPECCDDEDCQNDSYSENFCIGDEVYRYFYDYFCNDGSCDSNVTKELVESCADYCDEGVCKEEDEDREQELSWVPRFEAVNYYGNQGSEEDNHSENLISSVDRNNDLEFNLRDWMPVIAITVFILILLLLLVIFFLL